MGDSIHVQVFGKTDQGRRRTDNQDSMLIADLNVAANGNAYSLDANPAPGTQPGNFEVGPKGALLLVADGMGGAAAGNVASSLAVSAIEKEMMEAWAEASDGGVREFAQCLNNALESANRRIYETALENTLFYGMGTTATLAGVLGTHVYTAQVGDSRAYLVRNGEAVQITRDQSLVQELVDAGTMTEEEAEKSEHANKILQALGVSPNVKPVVTYNALRHDDVILLCSDGLTRVVKREEIADAVTRASDTAVLCQQLIDLANERGGPDNITVVVARVNGEGLGKAGAGDVVTRTNYAF